MQDPIEKIFLPDFLLPTPGTLTWVTNKRPSHNQKMG